MAVRSWSVPQFLSVDLVFYISSNMTWKMRSISDEMDINISDVVLDTPE